MSPLMLFVILLACGVVLASPAGKIRPVSLAAGVLLAALGLFGTVMQLI